MPAASRALGLLLCAALLAACRPAARDSDHVTLTVWAHAGQAAERAVITRQVAAFNARFANSTLELTFLPEGAYNGQVQAAALADDLPDVLEFDGPYLDNYAWAGKLRPIDEFLPHSVLEDLLPSIVAQGTYDGRLYAVGTFDSGLGLYARRSALAAIGARIPDGPASAWSAQEFDRVLAALARRDPDGAVLDLKLNYGGEWFTYGFSPVIESAGGDLVDRRDYRHASGVLNGPQSVGAMRRVQGWFRAGYVDPNLDDAAFVSGRVPLSWVGHWEYARYAAALGDDLVLLPLPDFGRGTRTGQGSWTWGVTRRCRYPDIAARFVEFLLEPQQVLAMSRANGAVPATHGAIALSRLYAPGGPLHLFVTQLTGGYAVPRPLTPAYPVISSVFQRAFHDVRNGVDVQAALDRAAALIDRDIADNHGYQRVARAGAR